MQTTLLYRIAGLSLVGVGIVAGPVLALGIGLLGYRQITVTKQTMQMTFHLYMSTLATMEEQLQSNEQTLPMTTCVLQ